MPATSLLAAYFGEQLDTNYTMHELRCPGSHVCELPSTSNLLTKAKEDSIDCVNAGLLSKIELLEAENRHLSCNIKLVNILGLSKCKAMTAYSVFSLDLFHILFFLDQLCMNLNIGALNGSNESDIHVNWIVSTSYS